jgi:hypothetical protein
MPVMRSLPPLVVLLLLAASCASFDEVRDFAAVSARATQAVPEIARDYRASIVRVKRYDSLRRGALLDEANSKAGEFCAANPDCAVPEAYAAGCAILTAYIDALARLADHRESTTGSAVQRALAVVQKIPGVPPGLVSSFGGLVKFLADAADQRYRRRQIDQALANNDPAVQQVLSAYRRFLQDYADLQLDRERIALLVYFEASLPPTADPATRLLVYDRQQNALDELASRRARARAIDGVLGQIAAAHGSLAAKSGRLTSFEVRRELRSRAAEIEQISREVQRAF